jgi:hypothetical protein
LTEVLNLKPSLSPVLTSKTNRSDNNKARRLYLRVPQKDLQEWQENLERISKAEMNTKKSLKIINAKYNSLLQRYRERYDDDFVENRKEKILERSIFVIDAVLKGFGKNKNGNR